MLLFRSQEGDQQLLREAQLRSGLSRWSGGCRYSLRDTLQKYAESDFGLLKIDFSNAFNQVSRSAFVQATCSEFPGLANWTNWCYGEESTLLYDHREVITSSSGVQQGDPLSLLLCLNELVQDIAKLSPVYQKWC